MEQKIPLLRTLLFLLMLQLAIRTHAALKTLAAVMCIALLKWLNIDDWLRSVQTGLYRVFFRPAALTGGELKCLPISSTTTRFTTTC